MKSPIFNNYATIRNSLI